MTYYQIKKIFEQYQVSVALSGNIIAMVRHDLKECGFRSFPIITLLGKPGTGKTSLAKACLRADAKSLIFGDDMRCVKKELEADGQEYYLLDDLANFESYQGYQKGMLFLDRFVRRCYSGDGRYFMITAEERAIERMPEESSCKSRLLLVGMDDFMKTADNILLMNWLVENREEMEAFWKAFTIWYQSEERIELLKNFLHEYRRKSYLQDFRTRDLIFCYWVSCQLISLWLKENGEEIDQKQLKKNCDCLVATRKNKTESCVQQLIKQVFLKNHLDIYMPVPREICNEWSSGRCNYERGCHGYLSECEVYNPRVYYNPFELLLETDERFAVLITEPSKVFQFPPFGEVEPLLIVRDTTLITLINHEIRDYNKEKGTRLAYFTAKRFHKQLFAADGCLYRMLEREHVVYTFSYPISDGSLEKVLIVRLSPELYKLVREKGKIFDARKNEYMYESSCLKKMCMGLRNVFANAYVIADSPWKCKEV